MNVGEVANTSNPLPVSSDITPANSDDDVDAKADNLLLVGANVPDVGNVTFVVPVVVNVNAFAPEVVRAPANVMVLPDCCNVDALTVIVPPPEGGVRTNDGVLPLVIVANVT